MNKLIPKGTQMGSHVLFRTWFFSTCSALDGPRHQKGLPRVPQDQKRYPNSPGLGPERVRSSTFGKGNALILQNFCNYFNTIRFVSTISNFHKPVRVFAMIRQFSQFCTPISSPVHFFLQESRTVLQFLLEQLFLV